MRKQFPACQKMEQQKLEAAAASKALLVIINTKSFQKQQPQFPTEKKKNGEAELPSTKITTNFGLRPNQYTPGVPARLKIQDGGRSKTFLIGYWRAHLMTSLRASARGRQVRRRYRHLGDFFRYQKSERSIFTRFARKV